MTLTPAEVQRYTQQLKLESVGLSGQTTLKNARVLCVGGGGLGCPLLLYLTTAGVGTIGIIDDDVVALDNLPRQVLYRSDHIGSKKTLIAKQQLTALNPKVNILAMTERLDFENAKKFISQYDIIADCSDNYVTRYLINDVCVQLNKPYVSASIHQFQGQCFLFSGKDNPCLRCLFPSINLDSGDCREGVLGVLPGLFGIVQANEIIKFLLNMDDGLAGQLLFVDMLKMKFSKFRLSKNSECPICAPNPDIESLTISKLNSELAGHEMTAESLQAILFKKEIYLIDVRSTLEHAVFNLGGIVIPLPELTAHLEQLDPNKHIIIYCESGGRSIEATKILLSANFKTVNYLKGGIVAWQKLNDIKEKFLNNAGV